MNAVLPCSDVELVCMEEVGYYSTGPYPSAQWLDYNLVCLK